MPRRGRRPVIQKSVIRRLVLLAALVIALAACAFFAQKESRTAQMRQTMPLGQRLGNLTLLGAVEWSSPRADFGGFSGLELEEDGAFTALTDKGHYARARLKLDPTGALIGIDGLDVARLHGADGAYLQSPNTDSEALRRGPDGAWYVSFEHMDRISRFSALDAPEEVIIRDPGLDALNDNGGLESMMVLPDGRFIGIAEITDDWKKGYEGWIFDGEQVETFRLARHGWFAPTDIALGPNGEWVYVLERRFTLIGGFAMRIRRFPLTALRAGAKIDAALLLDTPAAPLTENMEGLAATSDKQGRTILYAISDDNFLALQRTLLLQFRVEN